MLTLGASGCGGDGESGADATRPDTTAPAGTGADAPDTSALPEPLRILVTNDDGVGAPGIDVLVEALRAQPGVEVIVVAPATNQSGTGGSTTPGELAVADATTASGFPATAVAGFPADTVIWATDLGGLAERPDLVISGINNGQNLGPLTQVSGTVGAARAAEARGIPALAVSQGIADSPDFATGAELAIAWLEEHRDAIVSGEAADGVVENLNVPTCPSGSVRGVVDVPTATDAGGRDLLTTSCTSTVEDPADDIDAFMNGFAPLAPVPAT
ncbi:MAG: survival protein SurE [Acidimicrobiales bacterium]|nr:survival protein SurE [Acidimicrobiales bacterium]